MAFSTGVRLGCLVMASECHPRSQKDSENKSVFSRSRELCDDKIFSLILTLLLSGSCLCSGMMFLVNAFEPIEGEVRIDLRGRDIGMAQDGLNRAQVRAVLDHVSSAAMAQHVRTGMALHARRSGAHHLPDALTGQLS